MPKFMKLVAVLVAFALATFAVKWFLDNDPGLVGTTRSSFVESAIRTCLKNQSENPDNKEIPPSTISQYCTCYANGMADRVSINELKLFSAMEKTEAIQTILKPKVDLVVAPCIDAILK
jgi:hypothetical protein